MKIPTSTSDHVGHEKIHCRPKWLRGRPHFDTNMAWEEWMFWMAISAVENWCPNMNFNPALLVSHFIIFFKQGLSKFYIFSTHMCCLFTFWILFFESKDLSIHCFWNISHVLKPQFFKRLWVFETRFRVAEHC